MSDSDSDGGGAQLPPGAPLWRNIGGYLEQRSKVATSDLMPWTPQELGAARKFQDKLLNVRPFYFIETQELMEFELRAGVLVEDILSFEVKGLIRRAFEVDEKVMHMVTGFFECPGGYVALLELLCHSEIGRRDLAQKIAREEEARQSLADFHGATGGGSGRIARTWLRTDGWLESALSTAEWWGVAQGEKGEVTEIIMPEGGVSGALGDYVGKWEDMERLIFTNCSLRGALPPALEGCAALQELDLEANELRGTIPEQLGACVHLRALRLSHNMLTGSIPPSFVALTALTQLALEANSLAGSLEDELFEGMGSLVELDLRRNNFFGPLPSSLAACASLKRLSLGSNMHSETLPELGICDQLEVLYLQHNKLVGALPEGMGGCRALKHMIACGNKLTGCIPPELGMCETLLTLDLSSNRLTGPIPPSLGGLARLSILDLSFNRLEGKIPLSLSGCVSLYSMKLNNNRLGGEVPCATLHALRRLKFFFCYDNEGITGLRETHRELSKKTGLTFHLTLGPQRNYPKGKSPFPYGGIDGLVGDGYHPPYGNGDDFADDGYPGDGSGEQVSDKSSESSELEEGKRNSQYS